MKNVDIKKIKWVVLDDDPTGIQTVHDVAVYTDWNKDTLENALKEDGRLFYILTNSRGLTASKTKALHMELMSNLIVASKETGISFFVISRSDSTLRGHFPLETDIIRECLYDGLGMQTDGLILAPFFYAGGRITKDNIHYVKYGDELVPAGETEFAKDETFGYRSSNLTEYVEEKTEGRWKAKDVIVISLDDIKKNDIDGMVKKLVSAKDGVPIIVNAEIPDDLIVFCEALYKAIESGKKFLYRTAADFVKAVCGISDIPLLSADDMGVKSKRGGVIMIGSHTKKTTSQLERLKEIKNLEFIEYDSDKVLTDELSEETKRVSKIVSSFIEEGITAVVFTKRKVLTLENDSKEDALIRSAKISEAFTDVVSKLTATPSYIVGKGGITSSDIGTRALKVKRALALGQIQPGVPVWKTDENSRFPGIPYVIFPGNVGDEDTLLKAVKILQNGERN
ncbi:four-carbon acid sugar kinase family protein [Butyrivibrio sp. MB2005]|uniref:four-carbon acid sugar kinase family protein n=1 Tax=Butyrivibrio sp. MB2005 TaxID=1280678 RepID=UPI00041F1A86|nr:four-carbon acid sugar kinase family protein [Butyrivibrio sp. MB2005]